MPVASQTMVDAVSGAMLSVGSTSIGRFVSGIDVAAHNLIDGVIIPVNEKIVEGRGYEFRSNSAVGTDPGLTSQQMQVTKTSPDPRFEKIKRDAANTLVRATQLADALGGTYPDFDEVGAVHLQLTIPVPTTSPLPGFVRREAWVRDSADLTSQHNGETSSEDSERVMWAPPGAASSSTQSSDTEERESATSGHDASAAPPEHSPRGPQPLGVLGEALVEAEDSVERGEQRRRRVRAFFGGAGNDSSSDSEGSDQSRSPLGSEEWGEGPDSDTDPLLFTARAHGREVRSMATRSAAEEEAMMPCALCTPISAIAKSAFNSVRSGIGKVSPKAKSTISTAGLVIMAPTVIAKNVAQGTAKSVARAGRTALRAANPTGAMDLYVLDVTIPKELYATCVEVADTLLGEDKPAKSLQLAKAHRKLRRLASGKLTTDEYLYMEAITTLVTMAILMDIGNSGKNHCRPYAFTGIKPEFIDFFANNNLEEAIKDLNVAKYEAGHPVTGMVLAIPAMEVTGELNPVVVMYESNRMGEYELIEKKPVVGAVTLGVDLFGKQSPNDHKNPLTYISAVYRHLGDKRDVIAEDTQFEYVMNFPRDVERKMSPEHTKVWTDKIQDHAEDFRAFLTAPGEKFDFDFLVDGKPGAYSFDKYEAALTEQMLDETFYTTDTALNQLLRTSKHSQKHMQALTASANAKRGEDNMRGRAVISPGANGSESLHQARTSPLIKALEAFHARLYNHTNLKGLNEETKRIRMADFLRAVAKGAAVFGTDKSHNDSDFSEEVWGYCVRYLAEMFDIFEEADLPFARAYVYSPNEATAETAFPEGTLDLKYWTIKLTPLLALLLSGIGPTSFLNRIESSVEMGVAVLSMHGVLEYEKWRKAQRSSEVSTHPAWERHPQPHAAEFVHWEPLAPIMVTDTSVACDKLTPDQVITRLVGMAEGDDQVHGVMFPDDWAHLSLRDKIARYVATMSKRTQFTFVPAMTADDTDMIGRNAIFEMLSAWVGLPFGKCDLSEVAVIVPKVLKALRKLPHCSISNAHTVHREADGTPIEVERNAVFWSLALTKYYSLALINKESLGVRGMFLSHGDYCYQQLERITSTELAYTYAVTYGDRDPEARGIEEYMSTKFEHCGVMRDKAHYELSQVDTERVMRVCCCAWRSELPGLQKIDKSQISAALKEFDDITLTLELRDEHIADPMVMWEELDIGCLRPPLVMLAASSYKKVASLFRSKKLLADAEETVRLAREEAGGKGNGSTNKGGGPDNADNPSKKGGKGKGKAKESGQPQQQQHQKSKAKGGGKNKSPPKQWGKGHDWWPKRW